VAIARRGTPTTVALTASSTTVTISVPAAAVDGDLLLLSIFGNSATGPSITDPTGWTLLDGPTQAGSTSGPLSKVWYRIASSEPASYNITVSTSRWVGVMTAYSGVDTATPFSSHSIKAETVAGTGHTTNSIVPGSIDDWIVSFITDRSTSSATKNTNWTPTSPAVERVEVNNNTSASSPWCNMEQNDENGAVGSTAAKTHTSTSTISQANAILWIGSLKPAAAAGGGLAPPPYHRSQRFYRSRKVRLFLPYPPPRFPEPTRGSLNPTLLLPEELVS
jgi:hypothetical protein